MKNATWIVSSIMFSTALLTGCGSAAQTSPLSNGPTVANQSHSNQTRPAENNAGASGNANNASVNPNGPTHLSGTGTGTSGTTTSATAWVQQSMTLAKQGKVINIPFTVQQNMSVVQDTWGNPDSQNVAGAGIYATYESHAAALGFNKGEQIFDIRTYSNKLKFLTLADVKSVLGPPGDTRQVPGSVIYMYPAGADYQLLFVFSVTPKGSVSNHVNHVSVFWPQGTVDLMAATQPAPILVMDNAPGRTGNLFTFTIQNPPTGYRLVELEWLPNQGSTVVNTVPQAITNGSSGGIPPEFSISPDGRTYSFVYPSSLHGQTGTVRVIYQETSGAAMIGNLSGVRLP